MKTLPPGFELDQPADLPDGFVLDEPKPRSAGQEAGRQLGLTGRYAIEGVGGAVLGINDIVNMAVNASLQALGVDYRQPMTSQMAGQAADALGLPEPETATERVVGEASKFVAGSTVPMGAGAKLQQAGGRVAREVGEALTAQPGLQAASATTGGVASQVANEAGAGPGAQTAAGVAGAMLPSAGSVVAATTRGAARGSNPEQMRQNIADFERFGQTPSVGQASERRFAQGAESLASRIPGGAGVMARQSSNMADTIGENLQKRADELVPGGDSIRAGKEIERGIAGEGGFVDRFKARASQLYDEVDNFIDPQAPIPLDKTMVFLNTDNALTAGAPNTAKVLGSSYLRNLGVALNDDLASAVDSGKLPYEAVKAIRTEVGKALDRNSLVQDASKRELNQLYGALSDDLTAAARGVSEDAYKATNRASSYWRAGRQRIDNLERVVNKNGGPEAIFNAAMQGTREGVTQLRTVMKSLKPEERKFLTSAVVRRMGLATPGQQDATGEAFSLSTFLTNWSKLSPKSRALLFGTAGKEFNDDMNALARVAANIREGSSVWANPSKTSDATIQASTAVTAIGSLLTGNMGVFGSVMAGVAGANATARIMTNPNVVHWLARTTKMPPSQLPAQINALAQTARQEGDRDAALFAAALEQNVNEQAQDEGGN